MKPPRITLDQWLTFKTVVDEGSFARAAETLNKSQSAVSYAISQLNAQLPEPALTLKGRKSELSAAGEVLYRRADYLLREAEETEAIAQALASGVQAEVTIAVDSLLNPDALVCAFEEFSQAFPHTRLRILETSLSGTTEALLEKQADLVVSASTPVGFASPMLMQVHMLPVAAPDHPLVLLGREASEADLRAHRQVVLRDSGTRKAQDWLAAERRWTVSHFSSSVKMVEAGLGFAFLPRNWVVGSLDAGRLRQIPLPPQMERSLPLYLLLADRQTADPATRALYRLVRQELQQQGQARG